MSAPDLVCVRSPHAPGPFSTTELLFCGEKKRKKKKRGKEGGVRERGRERKSKLGSGSWMHMSGESVTIRETLSNYFFVCSISRWGW